MGSCLIQTRGKRACGAVAWSANAWAILASVASLHDRPPSTLVSLHNCSTTDVSNTLRSRGAKRSSGLLQGRYFGSTGRAARRQTGPDHHLAAGLHPRLPLPQGIPKVAGPTVSNNSSCLLFVLLVFFGGNSVVSTTVSGLVGSLALQVVQRNLRKYVQNRTWAWFRLWQKVKPLLNVVRVEDVIAVSRRGRPSRPTST